MAYLFVILFFAALVGIVRPYKFIPAGKRWHYGVAAFAAFVLVGVTAPTPDKPPAATIQDGKDSSQLAGNDSTKAERASGTAATEETSKWAYDETKDEMRGSSRRSAQLESENSVNLEFPYGEQSAFIVIRQDPQYGFDVMLRVRSGQILCNSFTDSYINAKFDNGPIRRFGCTGASDGTSDVAFINGARGFLAALKRANRTVMEAEFYQNGRVQYVFDTKGLKWE